MSKIMDGWTMKLTALLIQLYFASVATALAASDTNVEQSRVIVDFEDEAAIKLKAENAQAAVKDDRGNIVLEITTEEDASWPGVLVEPRSGKWDLSEFTMMKMDVRNLQDASLRVLLSVNNPDADGRRNCNTGSVSIPAGSSATLVLPFGTWHGDPGHPIDQSNIVSVRIFLDQPKRSHHFFVDNIRAENYDRSEVEKLFADPFFTQLEPVFGRGLNLGNALEATKEGEWGVTLEESYFDAIASAGFDSVRIPVRWSAHAETNSPYRIDPQFFARVDWAIRQSLSRKLRPIVNVHHYGGIMQRPDEHHERFLSLWQQIAEHYASYPKELAFEILNEPQDQLTADKWNELLADSLAVIRRSNPTRQVVVGPANFNAVDQLEHLKLPDGDQNLVVTFHYYSPFKFTHQGAAWLGEESRPWLGTKWTGTPAEKQAVMMDLDRAIRWGIERRRPIYLGEFGAYEKADLESRARWTRFVAQEAVKRKIGFAYWEFCSGFGVYDVKDGQWIKPLKYALLPKE